VLPHQLPRNTPARAVGQAFVDEATADHWDWLHKSFVLAKRRDMETMNLDMLEVDLPDAVITNTSTLLSYSDIFPFAEVFQFTHEGVEWFVDDMYCIRPGCTCDKTGLGLYHKPSDLTRSEKPPKIKVFLHLDYHTGTFKLEEKRSGCPDPGVLVETLLAANAGLLATFQHRHAQLRQLGRRLLAAPEKPDRGDSFPPEHQTVRAPARPGRNDPCPCGSGKKFKKCCGAI
jgi:hypothetical protein